MWRITSLDISSAFGATIRLSWSAMFTNTKTTNANDPEMINPKGLRIRVPEARVYELVAKGYILIDPNWKPTSKEEPTVSRTEPLPISQLKKQAYESEILAVTEI